MTRCAKATGAGMTASHLLDNSSGYAKLDGGAIMINLMEVRS